MKHILFAARSTLHQDTLVTARQAHVAHALHSLFKAHAAQASTQATFRLDFDDGLLLSVDAIDNATYFEKCIVIRFDPKLIPRHKVHVLR